MLHGRNIPSSMGILVVCRPPPVRPGLKISIQSAAGVAETAGQNRCGLFRNSGGYLPDLHNKVR